MKSILRDVTVQREFYIADDGKEFDDEDDCKAYEVTKVCERLKMRNYCGVKTNNIDNCQTVKLDTLDDIMSFIELCKFEGVAYKGIDAPGVYLYQEGCYGSCGEAWINISKIFKSFEESEDNAGGN